jgi:hypothetical protein
VSERRKRRRWRKADGADVAEGGCCLLEFFAAATCLVGLALIPLLMR